MYPKIDEKARREIRKAADILSAGGLVAIPTETVYGLAADADNKDAVLATFAVKGRPTNHPLIVHVTGVDALSSWAKTVPEEAVKLAEAFWPGPLTMVLPKSDRCGDFVTGGQNSVALRAPSHPWIRELLLTFEGNTHKGLTAPSANTFGRISPTSAKHVADDLGVKPKGKLDAILDGGICEVGVESTIVNLSGKRPEILRHGVITREMLEKVLGVSVPDAGSDAPRASGRLKSHYAPKTGTEIVAGDMRARLTELAGHKVAVMAPSASAIESRDIVLAIDAPSDVKDYAHNLYDALHRLDAVGAEKILIALPPQTAEWAAVNDRLGRAAADKNK